MRNLVFAWLAVVWLVFAAGQIAAADRQTAAALVPLYREFTFREKPKFNPQASFALEEWVISGLWEALQIQIFQPRVWVGEGVQSSRNPVIYSRGKLTTFVDVTGGGLLSGVVLGDVLYYSYGRGSGIHRSVVGRLRMTNGEPEKQESTEYVMGDMVVEKTADGRARVILSSFPGRRTSAPIGWIDLREKERLKIVDYAGREVSLRDLQEKAITDRQKR